MHYTVSDTQQEVAIRIAIKYQHWILLSKTFKQPFSLIIKHIGSNESVEMEINCQNSIGLSRTIMWHNMGKWALHILFSKSSISLAIYGTISYDVFDGPNQGDGTMDWGFQFNFPKPDESLLNFIYFSETPAHAPQRVTIAQHSNHNFTFGVVLYIFHKALKNSDCRYIYIRFLWWLLFLYRFPYSEVVVASL